MPTCRASDGFNAVFHKAFRIASKGWFRMFRMREKAPGGQVMRGPKLDVDTECWRRKKAWR